MAEPNPGAWFGRAYLAIKKVAPYTLIFSCLLLLAAVILYHPQSSKDLYSFFDNSLIEQNYEIQIRADEDMIIYGLGDFGHGVLLQGKEQKIGQRDFETIAVNEFLSRKIAYNRTLKDYRHPLCKNEIFDVDLPSTSVVIIFHNEPYSVLVRTVWSALNTGGKYVKEVILVDDYSDLPELGGKLDRYIRTRFPINSVQIVRLTTRSGLIKARLAGARVASGEVIAFLDAHCECNVKWLQHLLQRLKYEKKVVVVPIIDAIEGDTFRYNTAGYNEDFLIGGFNFDGHFTWITISDKEKKRRGSVIGATRSPTMAGGLFAINREYFWEVGSYDEQMEGWGGENLEMSFRVWQCGGIIETIPCSRVGHIFRPFHPYTIPQNKDTHLINTARLANVWMDDYAKYFFENRWYLNQNFEEIINVDDRKLLRQKLNCKSFEWYLDNVYPEKFVPGRKVVGHGRIKNPVSGLCIDLMGREDLLLNPFSVYPCHPFITSSQHISLTLEGELRSETRCAELYYESFRRPIDFDTVVINKCDHKRKDQKWQLLKTNQIQHIQTGLCLDTGGSIFEDTLIVLKCDANSKTQKWLFEFNQKNKFGKIPSEFNDIDGDVFGMNGDENGSLNPVEDDIDKKTHNSSQI